MSSCVRAPQPPLAGANESGQRWGASINWIVDRACRDSRKALRGNSLLPGPILPLAFVNRNNGTRLRVDRRRDNSTLESPVTVKARPDFLSHVAAKSGSYEGQFPAHRIRPGKNWLSAEGCLGKTRMA